MHGVVFHRPARIYPDRLPHDDIVLVAPPTMPQQTQGATSWLQYVLPVVGSLGSLAFFFVYQGAGGSGSPIRLIIPAVAILMALLSVFSGVLMRRQQKRTVQRQIDTNREKYRAYVDQQAARLDALARQQQRNDARVHPDLPRLAAVVERRETVWERRLSDSDFLLTRAGTGAAQLAAPVRVDTGTNPLMDYDQECMSRAQAVVARYSQIENAPIAIPLRDVGTLAISGDRSSVRALVRAMLCQVTAFHSPEDVRILTYFPQDATGEWSWMKWLPHSRRLRQMKVEKPGASEPLCLLADTVDDLRELLASQITPELERRRKLSGDKHEAAAAAGPVRPHFFVILDGFTPQSALARTPAINELFHDAAALGVTVLCLVADRTDEPAVLQARLEFTGAGWMAFEETAFGGRRVEGIHPDGASPEQCEAIARGLAPLTLGEKGAQRDLAEDVKLLDLLHIASPDDVDVRETWQPRSRQELLRVPIGMRADGEPLILDVKEAAEGGMGVHGLIIGATGSGKSELLRTIVTSLAITHDPETLNFVLADFKGGASFADLATLPHTAGMITNLASDLSLVDRMKAALMGEQERRQRLLRENGNLDNIKQYHAKRQMAPEMEPLPYLMILVDEFAELLANRPDFLELFVAIGRVGRSLGMHMLLATQRLGEGRISGLEGHLRYRICLRTFNAAESSSVLGTPDAFYLPSFPGIGYFKVDTNIYEQFKTALVSTPYVPATKDTTANTTVRLFGATGRLTAATRASANAAPATPASEGDALKTDMDVIIARVVENETARRQRASVHQVWLPPLDTHLALTDVLRLGGMARLDGSGWTRVPPFGALRVPIGLLDKPIDQAQEPLLLDFSGAGGHLAVVGAPQSGKSTLLQSLVASFAVTHTPRDVQFYCIDLGGGLLRALEALPHVGAVCGKTERDKIRRMVRQMRTVVEEREFLFRERRIDTIATFRQQRQAGELADVPFGDVFLVIDDLAQLQADFEGIDQELIEIVMSGLAYGVHVVVASNRWPDVKPKLRDNIGTRLELRLNDPIESEIGKAAALGLPVNVPGRGLLKGGLQFQTAQPIVDGGSGGNGDEREQPRAATVRESLDALALRMRAAWSGPAAPPIRMLPALVTPGELPAPDASQPGGVPIGLEEFQLDPVYIDLTAAGPHFLIFGDGETGKTSLLRGWIRELERRATPEQAQIALVDFRRNLLDFLGDPHLFAYACTPPMLKELVERLKGQLDGRMLTSSTLTIEELRNPRKWTGPHYYLFVDDYESLVTPAGNPLAPLADLIAQARDVGFHAVVARRVAGTSRTAFEPVFQRLRETGSPGLILSGDPQEGALLGTQRAGALPPGRGYLVRRNQRTTLVQAVYAEPAPVPNP